MCLIGTLLPWATRTDSVYGDSSGAIPMSAWSRVPFSTVVVLAVSVFTTALSAWILSTKRPLTHAHATWLGILGAVILVSLGSWILVVLHTPDPARAFPGFETSRTIPWVGAALVCFGALLISATGIVARVLPFVSAP